MQKKIYLFSFATALWLALSAFYSGPAGNSARTGPSAFHPVPPPEEPCGSEGITFSTANGDFPYGQMTQWTVPAGITEVTVIAKGSSGYMFIGGGGATAQSTFTVSPGDVLNVIVGTTGSGYGGGGSGVYNNTSSTLLIVAGGGGAEGLGAPGEGGRDTEAGGNNGGLAAAGGINGNGGSGAGGGGGAFSAGSGSGGGAAGVPNGGGTFSTSFGLGAGGVAPSFTGSGGGGGYSGGGASSDEFIGGGGGGSYVHPSGTNTAITAGANGAFNGAGTVSICYVPAPQCPPGNVELYSQAEVDAFVAAYPNCTEIAGDLILAEGTSDPINDISGLSAITSITGYLGIGYTDLASLDGLDNLAAVGTSLEPGFPVSIVLVNNASLADIGAFSNLTSLPGAIVLFQSSSLTNLNGFSNLNSVGGFYMFLETSLTSLAGLENITSYGGIGLAIYGSSALSSLNGLNDAATFASIDIESNPLLSACESPAICNHLAGGGPAVIQDNAPGCSSVAEVEAACNPCDLAIGNTAPTAESCPGANDGSITVSASCTTCSSIEYSIDGLNFQAGNTFSGLAPGPYTVTARDAGDASCEASDNTTVNGGPATDSDGDGTEDCNDGCPNDPFKVEPGACGCGAADADSDSDGVLDCNDGCPNDPAKTAPGICGCGVADIDTDGDGTLDCLDGCPNDPDKTDPGVCGCGIADTDMDGDGLADCIDACPNDPDNDADGDGVCGDVDNCPATANAGQEDADNDGLGDACDACPNDPDNDADADGVCGDVDNCPADANPDQADLDLDGLGDACDPTLDVCNVIAGLIAEVEALNLDGGLENALASKLENALSSFGNGNNNAATGKLGAFINQVQAQSGKKINSADAAALIAKAQAIIAAINSGNTDCGSAARVAPGGVVAAQSKEALHLEAFPNPFTHQVSLQYYLPADGRVQLSIISIHGQEVAKLADGQQAAGLQRMEWTNDTGLPAGVYFARLQTESGVSTLHLVLAR